MTTTTQLAFTYLVEGQASAEVTINDALAKIDAITNSTVINRTTTAPPGSPTEGDRYIIAATATGDWAGLEDQIAVYVSGWVYFTPTEGWTSFDVADTCPLVYTNSTWQGMVSDEAITASVTQTQAGGYSITAEVNQVTTVGTTDDAVTLPSVHAGRRCTIFNQAAARLQMFPAVGDEISNLGVDTVLTINGGGTRHLVGMSSSRWCVQ